MNSVLKVLVVILIFQGSNASLISLTSDIFSNATSKISSSVASLENKVSSLSLSDCLNSLNITNEGLLNLNGLIQKLNLTSDVNITSILNSLNVTISKDGLLDLKSLTQNFNLTNDNFTNVLSLLNLNATAGIVDFTSLAQKISSYGNVTEFLNSFTMNNTVDGLLDFMGLARKYVGTVEEYNVTTEDGYILKIFRIPGNVSNVVVVSHGVFSSSDDFILRGNTSLVYTLVKNDYDVWVINYRGSRYSRRHESLNPDTDACFWEYSMQEMGYYDLPAVIDFALNKTGQTQLSVVGHSEGTSAVFVLMSTKPVYNKKVKVFVALSPVCYLSDSGLALTTGMRLAPVINDFLLAFGIQELFGYESFSRKLVQLLCSQGTFGYDLCYKVAAGAVAGYNPDNLEPEFFTTVLGHYPAGTSRKNLIHYAQNGNQNRFAQYDYGTNNSQIYGSETAPDYNLTDVTCPVSLFMGPNDKILGLKAAERLRGNLTNVVGYHVVENELFNHVDFEFGKDAAKLVYQYVIDVLDSYNK